MRLVHSYPRQGVETIDASYSGMHWFGCIRTQECTTVACTMLGSHVVKARALTQSSLALSPREIEYYGLSKASRIGQGYQAFSEDLGATLPLGMWTVTRA